MEKGPKEVKELVTLIPTERAFRAKGTTYVKVLSREPLWDDKEYRKSFVAGADKRESERWGG